MKKVLIIILLGLLIGGSFAMYMFSGIKEEMLHVMSEEVLVTAFQIGVYTVYDNAIKVSNQNNGIVIEDEDKYRVYIAIFKDPEIISTMDNYYKSKGINVYLKKIDAAKEFLTELNKYEILLKESAEIDTIISSSKNILKLYGECQWVT